MVSAVTAGVIICSCCTLNFDLLQVLKETLRFHGPFSISTTKESPPEGVTLSGYHIPGGTQVMVKQSLYGRLYNYDIVLSAVKYCYYVSYAGVL